MPVYEITRSSVYPWDNLDNFELLTKDNIPGIVIHEIVIKRILYEMGPNY